MRLFLVRHGETAWNKDEVFRGQIDVALNEHGLTQAERTGEALRGVELAAVYASPLSRARETARRIAEPHGLEVIVEPALVDLNYGSWQGVSHVQVKERFPEDYAKWVTAPQEVRFAGGESLDDVKRRAMAAIEQMAGRHAGKNVAAVSHRVVNKVLLCAFLGLDNSRFWSVHQDTCAINVVEKDSRHGWIVRTMNETSHIQPLAAWFAKNKKSADF